MNSIAAIAVVVAAVLGGYRIVPQPGVTGARETQPESATTAPAGPLAALRAFEGRWRGNGDGQPGKSTVERAYEVVMGGRFLHVRNTSTYPPQEKNPKGERHEDWGMFSFDSGRKKLVLRQFHIEGFVNQYVVDRISEDGREIVFVTEAIENIPAGFRGRETYRFTGSDSLQETFEIAEPGKDFEVYSTNTLTRVRSPQ